MSYPLSSIGIEITKVFSVYLAAKGRFINENGLKGFAMWEVAGDEHDVLLDAISDAMEIQGVCA